MARGNQRDAAREKNQKKLAQKQRSQGKDGRPEQRNANDSAALAAKIAQKQALKKEQEQTQTTEATKKIVTKKKKVAKTMDTLDLLDAGLGGGKKKGGKK